MHPALPRVSRRLLACGLLAAVAGLVLPARAHHGWAWAEGENTELAGEIVAAKLGNPHGELTMAVGNERWIVEVGQPWRNERAGLKDAMLAKGVRLTVSGHRHQDPSKKVFKAERIVIGGKTYDLYPDRN